MLYICATPIGNLKDITLRVLDTLREVDLIAAEDTRHTRILLSAYDIHTPLESFHEHSSPEKADMLMGKLHEGLDIAYVSDAGEPLISDPGAVLVSRCIEEGIPFTSLPGASALPDALIMSGMETERFVFEGFLPRDKKAFREAVKRLVSEPGTVVIYEAPHRLKKTLAALSDGLGGHRRIAICRELTKKYEEVIRTDLAGASSYYEENEPRGEYVLVLEGAQAAGSEDHGSGYDTLPVPEHVKMYEEQGLPRMEAMKAAAKDRGVRKSDIYKELLRRGENDTKGS